jgi:hypothetical protein
MRGVSRIRLVLSLQKNVSIAGQMKCIGYYEITCELLFLDFLFGLLGFGLLGKGYGRQA